MRDMSRIPFLMFATALLTTCGPARPRADLVFLNSAEVETLDPALITDQVSMRLGESLFEGLCRLNSDGKPEPGVAERWEISEDKRRYTFRLRANAVWSNGAPVTAQDFVKSWERVLLPATGSEYSSQLYPLKNAQAFNEGKLTDFSQVGVKALNDRTLETTLENPIPYWIDLCAFTTLCPVHMPTVEKYGDAWKKVGNLVGNGPYLLDSWLIDDHISLKKNPLYWDAANVKMRTVDVLPISDANTALNYFLTGQADLMMDKAHVPPSLQSKLKQQTWFHTGTYLGTWFIRMNATKAPFTDPRVRRAFALAIDRKRIVEKITQLGEDTAHSFTPPGAGQNFQPPIAQEFDPKLARQLLAEAGFPGGKGFPRVEYLHLPVPVERNIAVELQAMWKENLGVEVGLTKQEQRVWLSSMRELKYDMCRSSWVGDYNDPNTFLDFFTTGNGNNRTGWSNKRYDELILAAAAEADVTKRHALFTEAETILCHDEPPIVPIYHYVGIQYRRDGLQGVRSNLVDDHPFRAMWWK